MASQEKPGRRRTGSLHELLSQLSTDPGRGLTIVLDKLQPLTSSYLRTAAPYMDYAKIGWGLALITDPKVLEERINTYHETGVRVLAGGTLLELAEHRGLYTKALDALEEAGFDAVEVSAGSKLIPLRRRLRMIEEAERRGFTVLAEVGRKKPQLRMEPREALREVEAFYNNPSVYRVVLDSRESGRNSCLYDAEGRLRRSFFEALVARFNPDRLVFEAPLASQQAVLVRKLGPRVNLGNIGLYDVLALESLRQGLRGDTFASPATTALWIEGPPSVKFVYFVLQSYGLLGVRDISLITGLPPRTVYDALYSLRERGLVDSVPDQGGEKKWYAL